MSPFTQDFFLIKKSNTYFGHINHTTKPTVFAFKKQSHADSIRKELSRHTSFSLDDHHTSSYKLTFNHQATRKRFKHLEVEQHGSMDLSIYMSLNGIQAQIVEDIIEDDEGSMYLVNHNTSLETIFVNSAMMKMHFNKVITESNSKRD
jgi:hypothetical protein